MSFQLVTPTSCVLCAPLSYATSYVAPSMKLASAESGTTHATIRKSFAMRRLSINQRLCTYRNLCNRVRCGVRVILHVISIFRDKKLCAKAYFVLQAFHELKHS